MKRMMKHAIGIAVLAMAGTLLAQGDHNLTSNNYTTGWTGTYVGGPVLFADGINGAIGIGNGWTNGVAHVTADGAVQIGPGSNGVANTIKFLGKYVMTSSSSAAGATGDVTVSTFYDLGYAGIVGNATFGAGTNKVEITAANGNILGKGTLIINGAATVGGAATFSNTVSSVGRMSPGSILSTGTVSACDLAVTNPSGTAAIAGAATVGTTLGVTGALNSSGGGTLSGGFTYNGGTFARAVSNAYCVTGGAITYTPSSIMVLTPTGGALNVAATITINKLAPSYSGTGSVMYVVCDPTASQTLAIASSGTYLGPVLAISTGEVAGIVNYGLTNYFTALGQ